MLLLKRAVQLSTFLPRKPDVYSLLCYVQIDVLVFNMMYSRIDDLTWKLQAPLPPPFDGYCNDVLLLLLLLFFFLFFLFLFFFPSLLVVVRFSR